MWTKEKPTKAGLYWFIGRPFSKDDYADRIKLVPELYMVHAHMGAGGSMHFIANGNFMENFNGLWQEMVVPELPEEFKNIRIR